jgi:acetamidase/formamidase
MNIHMIRAERRTLHGHFSGELAPILTVEPGDTVRMNTLDAGWYTDFSATLERPPRTRDEIGIRFPDRLSPEDDGHALCGPIAVRGARPGMAIAVHYNRIIPGEWGWTLPWFGAPPEERDRQPILLWQLDAESATGRNQHGHTVTLAPFLGVTGMPADLPGVQSTTPPRVHGGNFDCQALVAGSTLYLPVAVEGGLISFGDGHAAQGDGESCGTGIECPMSLVDVTLGLVQEPILATPYASTPSGWVTLGVDEDLQQAHDMALAAMQAFVSSRLGVGLRTALALISVAADVRVTQTVNTTKGVHVILPHGALR